MPDRDQDNLQNDPPSPALADGSPEGGPRRRVSARRIALAAVCVVGGVLGSVLGAGSIASHDGSTAVSGFQQSSTAIASSLKLSVQREEELTVSASTFFARNPKASPEEFATWVKWAQTVRRFPELENLGLVAIVKS